MYQMMARFARRQDWTFMNYGYAPRPADAGADAAVSHDELTRTGLRVISRHDITDNVLAALDRDNERKVAQIHASVDRLGFAEGWLMRLMEEFGGSPGSTIYDRFRRGETAYLSYALVKPPLD